MRKHETEKKKIWIAQEKQRNKRSKNTKSMTKRILRDR
jgi:hypothetical protein